MIIGRRRGTKEKQLSCFEKRLCVSDLSAFKLYIAMLFTVATSRYYLIKSGSTFERKEN